MQPQISKVCDNVLEVVKKYDARGSSTGSVVFCASSGCFDLFIRIAPDPVSTNRCADSGGLGYVSFVLSCGIRDVII